MASDKITSKVFHAAVMKTTTKSAGNILLQCTVGKSALWSYKLCIVSMRNVVSIQ